jgi:hypothetical protein
LTSLSSLVLCIQVRPEHLSDATLYVRLLPSLTNIRLG